MPHSFKKITSSSPNMMNNNMITEPDKYAIGGGWKKIGDKWICPECSIN